MTKARRVSVAEIAERLRVQQEGKHDCPYCCNPRVFPNDHHCANCGSCQATGTLLVRAPFGDSTYARSRWRTIWRLDMRRSMEASRRGRNPYWYCEACYGPLTPLAWYRVLLAYVLAWVAVRWVDVRIAWLGSPLVRYMERRAARLADAEGWRQAKVRQASHPSLAPWSCHWYAEGRGVMLHPEAGWVPCVEYGNMEIAYLLPGDTEYHDAPGEVYDLLPTPTLYFME